MDGVFRSKHKILLGAWEVATPPVDGLLGASLDHPGFCWRYFATGILGITSAASLGFEEPHNAHLEQVGQLL